MAAGLRRTGFFRGKGREEIINALGIPDNQDWMRYNCRHVNNALIVSLKDNLVWEVSFFDQ